MLQESSGNLMTGRYDFVLMFGGLKWAVSCMIPPTVRRAIRAAIMMTLDYDIVFSWLNQATCSSNSCGLTIESGETWLVMADGMKLKYISAMNSVSSIIMKRGSFEDVELRLCLSNLTDGSVFFDVGANVGMYSIAVARRFPSANIHAFEPVPSTISTFRQNMAKNGLDNGNITLNEIALSDVNGDAYITSDFHSSNYITTPESRFNKIPIRCMTIDNYVRDRDINRLDFVKIDVEGHEMKLAKGAEETLARLRPKVLAELNKRDFGFFDRKVTDESEFIDFLAEFGYTYSVIDDNDKLVHMDDVGGAKLERGWHNYLFCHKDTITAGRRS